MERFIHESLAVRKSEKNSPDPCWLRDREIFLTVFGMTIIKPNDLSKNALYSQLLVLLSAQSFYVI